MEHEGRGGDCVFHLAAMRRLRIVVCARANRIAGWSDTCPVPLISVKAYDAF